jgi:DNA polymerase-3 subunit epsilon
MKTPHEMMRRQGISRRGFLKYPSLTAASLALGSSLAPRIASAMETQPMTPTPALDSHGPRCMNRQIVLDTETTGLSARYGDRIIELGCVELVNRQRTGHDLHFYFNPERDSHEEAIAVHGISNQFLRDKPRFADQADQIVRYLEGAEIIIHNAPFDVGFLNHELALIGKPALDTFVARVTDTLALARQLYPGQRNSLDTLCEHLGVDNSSRKFHGAHLDAALLADVYLRLTPQPG